MDKDVRGIELSENRVAYDREMNRKSVHEHVLHKNKNW